MNKKEQAQKELDQIKDRVKDLERILKEPEISKEKEMSDFLFDMLNGTIRKMTGKNEVTHYRASDNEWLFQQDYENGRLWVRYSLIWSVFETKYSLNYKQTIDFIKGWIEANTKWRGLTPSVS